MKGKSVIMLCLGTIIGITGGFILGKNYAFTSLKKYMKSDEFKAVAEREFEKEFGPLFNSLGSK